MPRKSNNGKNNKKNGKKKAAPKSKKQPKPVPTNVVLRHKHNSEVREASGFEGRAIADLKPQDLVELAATYATGGMDGVQATYGLSRGEVALLCADTQFQTILTIVAQAQRLQAVTHLSFSVPRLVAMVEHKLREEGTTVSDAIEALRAVKDCVIEIGQVEQRVNVTHNHRSENGKGERQTNTYSDSEVAKLGELQRQLNAMSLAGGFEPDEEEDAGEEIKDAEAA